MLFSEDPAPTTYYVLFKEGPLHGQQGTFSSSVPPHAGMVLRVTTSDGVGREKVAAYKILRTDVQEACEKLVPGAEKFCLIAMCVREYFPGTKA